MDNVRTPSDQSMRSARSLSDVSSSLSELQINGPDMIVDGLEQYNQQQDEAVHDIHPDPIETNGEPGQEEEIRIRADDCE